MFNFSCNRKSFYLMCINSWKCIEIITKQLRLGQIKQWLRLFLPVLNMLLREKLQWEKLVGVKLALLDKKAWKYICSYWFLLSWCYVNTNVAVVMRKDFFVCYSKKCFMVIKIFSAAKKIGFPLVQTIVRDSLINESLCCHVTPSLALHSWICIPGCIVNVFQGFHSTFTCLLFACFSDKCYMFPSMQFTSNISFLIIAYSFDVENNCQKL